MPGHLQFAVATVLLGVLLTSCATEEAREHLASDAVAAPRAAKDEPVSADGLERLRVMVLEVLPHDPQAFTQGLEMADGTLYESTGLVGRSLVRAGPAGGRPTLRKALLPPLFGEGITVVGRKLWQLTWRNRIAIERDAKTLSEVRRVPVPRRGLERVPPAVRKPAGDQRRVIAADLPGSEDTCEERRDRRHAGRPTGDEAERTRVCRRGRVRQRPVHRTASCASTPPPVR